jgi:uroporphyrinogen-III synthase
VDDLPLAGRTVGITADRRWREQADLFFKRGASILHGPTMRTVDLSRDERLRRVTEELVAQPPDYGVVTTGMGFRMWLEAAGGWGLDRTLLAALGGGTVIARGAKSASAATGAGLDVAWRAPRETLEEIVEHLSAEVGIERARVAVQLFDLAGHPALEVLRTRARALVEVPVYRWRLPDDPGPAHRLIEAAVARRLDAVTFTSQPAVHHLFRLAEGTGSADALRAAFAIDVLPACIGPVCAAAAREEGIERLVHPEPPRLPAMVRQVTELLGGRG